MSGEITTAVDPTAKELFASVFAHCQRYCLDLSVNCGKRWSVAYSAPRSRTKGNGKAAAGSLGEALALLDHKLLARYQHAEMIIDSDLLADRLALLFAKTQCFGFYASFGLAEPAPHGIRFSLSFPGRGYSHPNDPLAMVEEALSKELTDTDDKKG